MSTIVVSKVFSPTPTRLLKSTRRLPTIPLIGAVICVRCSRIWASSMSASALAIAAAAACCAATAACCAPQATVNSGVISRESPAADRNAATAFWLHSRFRRAASRLGHSLGLGRLGGLQPPQHRSLIDDKQQIPFVDLLSLDEVRLPGRQSPSPGWSTPPRCRHGSPRSATVPCARPTRRSPRRRPATAAQCSRAVVPQRREKESAAARIRREGSPRPLRQEIGRALS